MGKGRGDAVRTLMTFACVAAGVALSSCVSATVLRVPLDSPTIQAGVRAAADGDTVLVAEGTFTGDGNRDIDFLGKAILLTSEHGPGLTIIDCQGNPLDPHRGVCFHLAEDSTSILSGFTIRNGYVTCGGGAILCDGASPIICDNVIVQNRASIGGGVHLTNGASPALLENIVSENRAVLIGGGILCWFGGTPLIAGNTITGNTAEADHGGGIGCGQTSASIIGNTIAENVAYEGAGVCFWGAQSSLLLGNLISGNVGVLGGGMRCHGCSPAVVGNAISGNGADWGGGIYCDDSSSPEILCNTVTGNEASLGAGIFIWASSCPSVRHNTVAANTAFERGGGLYCWRSCAVELSGNTIAANRAWLQGGGIDCFEDVSVAIVNSIFWGDSAGVGSEILVDSTSSIAVTYSDVEGGWPGAFNIDADPRFVLRESRDYRLLWTSPCIDAGHPDSLDPDGTICDMGAHFFDQRDYLTIYVTPHTTDAAPGDSISLTCTIINRHAQQEEVWIVTRVVVPEGDTLLIGEPRHRIVPSGFTGQAVRRCRVPPLAPAGRYECGAVIGMPPSTIYDEDSFALTVVSSPSRRE
jgi:hypothetical protein